MLKAFRKNFFFYSATLGTVAGVDFRVTFAGPLDVRASLELFRRSGDDLIDRWDGVRLVRVLQVDGRGVPFIATMEGTLEAPALRVAPAEPAIERMRPAACLCVW